MTEVVAFTGKTPRNHREIFCCASCGSRNFRFVKEGASAEIHVECSNCENIQTWVGVKDLKG